MPQSAASSFRRPPSRHQQGKRLLLTALTLGCLSPWLTSAALAAGPEASTSPAANPDKAAKATKAGTQPKHTAGKTVAARRTARSSEEGTGEDEGLSPGQGLYQILIGEFAALNRQPDVALSIYADTARRSREPQVLARTVELAAYARQFELAQLAAALWLEVEPESNKAREALVSAWLMLDRPEAAEPHLAALLANEAQDKDKLSDNLLRLNRLFAGVQDRQAIPPLVERLTAPYLQLPEAHYARSQAAFAARQPEQALAAIATAQRLRPNWEEAVLFEAQLLSRSNRTGDALSRLHDYLDRHPQAHDSRLLLARLLVSQQDYPAARRELERLTAADGNDRDALYPLAVLYLQTGDNATSERLFKHLLTLGHPDRQAIQYFLGRIAAEENRRDDARYWYEQVSHGEHYLNARKHLAQLFLQQGQLDQALSVLRSSKQFAKGDRAQLLLVEAQLLRSADRQQQAYELLEQALNQFPNHPQLIYDLALQAERIGRFARAETLLQHLIELDPENSQALNALGYSLAERNIRLDEARQLIERALALEPDEPAIIDSMGWVLFRQQQADAALPHLQRAYQLLPEADIGQHLGEVLWHLGRYGDARRIWEDALRQHPDNSELKTLLQRALP